MKKLLFLFLGLSLVFTACKKDDEEIIDADLHYDTANQSAPFLEAGVHEAAARFTANQTRALQGRNLIEVDYYLLEMPAKVEVRVFGMGTADEPGNLLYTKDVTSTSNGSSWNTHVLDTPVEILGEDLWVCVKVLHNSRINSVGCDVGPANNNGDWTFSDSDNDWKSLRDRTEQNVNINWNIRGKVSGE